MTLASAATWWLEFLYGTVRDCAYDTEVDGSRKRFSIGETVLLALAAALVVALLLTTAFPGQFLMVAMGGGATFTLILGLGTLIVAYDWSYSCLAPLPALPQSLGDDLLYFAAHTLAPKCPVLGGVVNEADYDNSNCYACEGWRDGRWTIPSFTLSRRAGGLYGFEDLGYNLAFSLKVWWPALFDALRDGSATIARVPVLDLLFFNDAVRARLDAFAMFDGAAVSPVVYSQIHLGNALTLLPNLAILVALASLIWFLLPLLERAFALLVDLAYVAFLAALFVAQCVALISVMAATAPAAAAAVPLLPPKTRRASVTAPEPTNSAVIEPLLINDRQAVTLDDHVIELRAWI